MTSKDPHLNSLPGEGPGGDADLHDAFMAQALAQAPDRSELPDWHVRKAVLDHAHDAVAAAEELIAASRSRTAWWRIGTWLRSGRIEARGRSAMPWAAGLATVVVGVLITLVWQGEPVPDARPDHESWPRVASPEMKSSPRERLDRDEAPETGKATEEASTEPGSADRNAAQPDAAGQSAAGQSAVEQRAVEKKVVEQRAAEQRAPGTQASGAAPKAAPAAPLPPLSAVPPSAPLATPSIPSTPSMPTPPANAGSKDGAREQGAFGEAGTDSAPAAEAQALSPSQMQDLAKAQSRVAVPPAPAASMPMPQATARPVPQAPSSQSSPSSTPTPQAPPAPQAPAEPTAKATPDYASLSRWSELHIASVSGQIRTVPRVEGSNLVVLLNEAAAQESSGEVLRELPQWRVSLERKGQPLALLEVGRSQLRWTEGASAPITSRPAPALLEALHAALREAVRAPSGRGRK